MARPYVSNEPIYSVPPMEQILETMFRADLLSEQRDWGHDQLGLRAVHDKGYLGEGVLIAICDTGVDASHQDLAGNLVVEKCSDHTGSGGFLDAHGHGTFCAGIAAAMHGNGIGIVGAAPKARHCAKRVLDEKGRGSSSWIADGINRSVSDGAEIISLSLGGPMPDSATRAAIQRAAAADVWTVAAAGNDGQNAVSYPGHYPEVCAVCATGPDGRRASFSTLNVENDVSAPGVSVLSTLPSGRYGRMSGTSMATPYVAGGLALVRSAIKKAGRRMPKQAEILAAIQKTSIDVAPDGRDTGTGWGILNVAGLIELFLGSEPPSPPPLTETRFLADVVVKVNSRGQIVVMTMTPKQ